tara:strand:- start:11379 stop:12812 length:1434 start_codon:yes stop_codon:yes gene_type:complete
LTQSQKLNADIAAKLLVYRTDPVLFVQEQLGAHPTKWQREALAAAVSETRISIRSGHGVGKSTFLAWLILWFMLTRIPVKVMATANRQDQIFDVLWSECRAWHRRLQPLLRNMLEITSDKISYLPEPEANFAVARTARKESPEAFQGMHQKHMLLIADEASGIDNVIFEAGAGAMSTPGAITVMTGNPTRTSGFFFNSFHGAKNNWWTRKVSCEELIEEGAEYVSKTFPAEIANDFGIDSNAYRVRVLGEFPTTEDEQVIPFELAEAAVERDVVPTDIYRTVWGLDVARFGDDKSALCKRRGNTVLEPVKWWQHKDLMQTTGIVKYEYEEAEDKPSEILVDVIGLGGGVVDRLYELGLPVRGINVAESASAKDIYARQRDELWFKARDWFLKRDCSLPDDGMLLGELVAPLYSFTSSGKMQVESKSDMKRRGFKSPDLADAFVLTFAGGMDQSYDMIDDLARYREKRNKRVKSWMSM